MLHVSIEIETNDSNRSNMLGICKPTAIWIRFSHFSELLEIPLL